jgi:hypothetical protein
MRLLLALLAASLAGCANGSAPPGSVVVRGRIVDAETGEPVPRTSIHVHAFDDATKRKVSLAPEDDDAFELTAPAATVRLRVADTSGRYLLNEQTFTVAGGVWDGTVRMVPTHHVHLHGRILWRDGEKLRPPSEGDGSVQHAFLGIGPKYGVRPAEDGSYSVRVPRELLPLRTVNTSRGPNPATLDLTGFEGDEKEYDIILE